MIDLTAFFTGLAGRFAGNVARPNPLPADTLIYPGATGMGRGNLSLAMKRQAGVNATPNEILAQSAGINRGWTYDPVTNPLEISNRRSFGSGGE